MNGEREYPDDTIRKVSVKVHSGIYSMFEDLWKQLEKIDMVDPYDQTKKIALFEQADYMTVGGHSLGAALAHLCTLRLIEHRYCNYRKKTFRDKFLISVSTFACPAVFNFGNEDKKTEFFKCFNTACGILIGQTENLKLLRNLVSNYNNINDIVVVRSRTYGLFSIGYESLGTDINFNHKTGGILIDHTKAYSWLKYVDFANGEHFFVRPTKENS